MRLWLIAVGRAKSGPVADLVAEYARRSHWPLAVKEVDVRPKLVGDALRRREATLLMAAVPAGARTVALDEKGADLTSAAFAARIGGWRDTGTADLAFLIGGADGLDPSVGQAADFTLALGRMTWPHMLVRAMLAEQLYRAQMILTGHPYHRA